MILTNFASLILKGNILKLFLTTNYILISQMFATSLFDGH